MTKTWNDLEEILHLPLCWVRLIFEESRASLAFFGPFILKWKAVEASWTQKEFSILLLFGSRVWDFSISAEDDYERIVE